MVEPRPPSWARVAHFTSYPYLPAVGAVGHLAKHLHKRGLAHRESYRNVNKPMTAAQAAYAASGKPVTNVTPRQPNRYRGAIDAINAIRIVLTNRDGSTRTIARPHHKSIAGKQLARRIVGRLQATA